MENTPKTSAVAARAAGIPSFRRLVCPIMLMVGLLLRSSFAPYQQAMGLYSRPAFRQQSAPWLGPGFSHRLSAQR